MTEIPADELKALLPCVVRGHRVVELGNKKNTSGLYRDWYAEQGMKYLCVDWNGLDGAIKIDMGLPLNDNLVAGWAPDVLTNFGFTEHVWTDQRQCWQNIDSLMRVGSAIVFTMPCPGAWSHHGIYQPHLSWYERWALANGYEVELLETYKDRKRWTNIGRLRKVKVGEPFWFTYDGIHITDRAARVQPDERNVVLPADKRGQEYVS